MSLRGIGFVAAAIAVAPVASANLSALHVTGQLTALDGGPPAASYLQVNENLVGIEFSLAQPVALGQVAGIFRAVGGPSIVYGAVAPITPGGIPQIDPNKLALISVNNTASSSILGGTVTDLLQPGRYALLFGIDRHGASGEVGVISDAGHVNALSPELPFFVSNSGNVRTTPPDARVAFAALGSLLTTPSPSVRLKAQDRVNTTNLITFETGDTGLPTVPGVTFLDTFGPGPDFSGVSSFTTALIGRQAFGNTVSGEYLNLGLQFAQGMHEIGFWINDGFAGFGSTLRANTITFRALDASGALVYATNITIPDGNLEEGKLFIGFESDIPVRRLEWLSNNEGFFAVDNISYSTVPEPSGIVLLAGASLSLVRRRRRCTAR